MKKLLVIAAAFTLIIGCKNEGKSFIDENINFAGKQYEVALKAVDEFEKTNGKIKTPFTIGKDGDVKFVNEQAWVGGFFPGSMWYMYELTGDEKYAQEAQKLTEAISGVQYITDNHDVGFICMCSFGNGMRLKGLDYKDIIVQTAESLCTRWREAPGLIQSWETSEELDRKCPVIIDNMMNLELLFKASELTGNDKYRQVAIRHADRTLKEHFRADGSTWHVVDYDPQTGDVRKKVTAQGYSDDSIWSRGQAWAIYGYAMTYRFTGDRKYIEQAIATFNMMKNHKNMAEDCVPWWDMCAPNVPDECRDASSAAIIASALYEISTMDVENPAQYKEYADKIMISLASPAYRAQVGTNGGFLLMHSVGSIPHGGEVDKPLNYADYYFLEALKRKRDIETK